MARKAKAQPPTDTAESGLLRWAAEVLGADVADVSPTGREGQFDLQFRLQAAGITSKSYRIRVLTNGGGIRVMLHRSDWTSWKSVSSATIYEGGNSSVPFPDGDPSVTDAIANHVRAREKADRDHEASLIRLHDAEDSPEMASIRSEANATATRLKSEPQALGEELERLKAHHVGRAPSPEFADAINTAFWRADTIARLLLAGRIDDAERFETVAQQASSGQDEAAHGLPRSPTEA